MTTTNAKARFPQGHFQSIEGTGLSGRPIKVQVGDNVRFLRSDGKVCADVVRQAFYAYHLLAPYADNYSEPAVVLTEHSWTPISRILEVRN